MAREREREIILESEWREGVRERDQDRRER